MVDLAAALAPPAPPSWVRARQGVVTAVRADGTADVLVGGDQTATPVRLLAGVGLGDTVWTLAWGGVSRLCLGPLDTGWIVPTFTNGWGNFGSGWDTVAYRRIGSRVHLRGLALAGATTATPTSIFVLLAGFRPAKDKIFVAQARTAASVYGAGRIDCKADGGVVASASAAIDPRDGGWVSLDGISYDV